MPHEFRVYGHLAGLDDSQIRRCLERLRIYECVVQGHVLDFVHEGGFVDVDSDLEDLVGLIGPEVRGVIDVINHQDWEMHRITLSAGTLTRARIALDNALDTAYASERRQ